MAAAAIGVHWSLSCQCNLHLRFGLLGSVEGLSCTPTCHALRAHLQTWVSYVENLRNKKIGGFKKCHVVHCLAITSLNLGTN
eukprot:4699686-Amphidinium_carterae.1